MTEYCSIPNPTAIRHLGMKRFIPIHLRPGSARHSIEGMEDALARVFSHVNRQSGFTTTRQSAILMIAGRADELPIRSETNVGRFL
jgi:hypothetical protein